MKQLFYKIIYSGFINSILTNFIKYVMPFLPKGMKLPPSGQISIQLENGSLKMKTNQTNYLTSCVFWDGYKNFEYTPIFEKLAKKTNTFYDVGANIGYYSLLAAKINPNMKVKSFEPSAGPLHYLRENVALNNLKNIKVEALALADTNGEIVFYEEKSPKYTYIKYNLAGEGNAGSKTLPERFNKNTVKAVTFDDYLQQNPNDVVELMKMDTEGTEHYILKKAHHLLSNHKPLIICETLFNTIEKDLEEILIPYGYEFYNHVGTGLQKVDSIKRTTDNGVRNCFFVHPSKKQLIEEFIVA
ncbi:MAG: FkbM family methyltransferase [Bacteroidia bacterium]|nr:FkbM family methyltransferase [Bacteroidia bacterium]